MRTEFAGCGIAALAFAWCAPPAIAQEASEADVTGLAEIIVTAQKRPEVAQKAPLVVTSIDPDALRAANVNAATDLQRVVPNLTAQSGGGAGDPGGASTLFAIRGLGASPTGPQGSAGVAVHMDGIYVQSGISSAEFFDLERVEVSPGPQGTLYGRSAAAGAVNVLPAKPVMRPEGSASVLYGNYDAVIAQAMLNIGSESSPVAVRAAFQRQKHDGYYSNGYDAQDTVSGRLQILYKPTYVFSLRVVGAYAELSGRGAGTAIIDGPALPAAQAILPTIGNPDVRKASFNEYCFVAGRLVNTCVQDVSVKKTQVYAEMSYDLGGAVVTIVPFYGKTERQSTFATAPLPFSTYNQQPYTNTQYNLESRISSGADSDVKWVFGGNYYRNSLNTLVDQFPNTLIRVPVPPPAPVGTTAPAVVMVNAFQDQRSRQESYAAFGQVTYPVSDAVRLTVGGRYNYDKSSTTQVLGNNSIGVFIVNGPGPIQAPGVPFLAAPGVSTPVLTGTKSFKAFTYRVAVDADVGPRSIVYASVGSGYKPGGLNDGGPRSSTTPASPFAPEQFFGPERVTHFELGSKNRFLNNTLQVNLAAYYDDYKNYQNGQTQIVNPLAFGALGFVVTNAGKARVYGAEASIKWQTTQNDIFEVAVNYLDAKFSRYVAPAFLSPSGPTPALDISGFALPNAPKFSGIVSYRHSFDLGGVGRLDASATSRITDGYWVYFAQAPGTYQTAHSSTTLDLTWRSPNDMFTVSAFVSNLEDNDIKVFASYTSNYTALSFAPPRTYGARVGVKF
ncbi:TonB-dependent receptor [Novosphingobium sp.]|uniref:TonB-dependent receptor n=1 Tax=Novosphingobium sp. TaxID=1874826 RepID=UPI00261C902C|nr:TonB-dependent receptor [Novosphingobium sp.]